MDERILRAKWRLSYSHKTPHHCNCGQGFMENETVFLYPVYDNDEGEFLGPEHRIMLCMTCHFHLINDLMEAHGR